MQHSNFINANPATHFGIDCEDFAEAVQFDEMCEANWPIWVVFQNGTPVGWFDESADIGCVKS